MTKIVTDSSCELSLEQGLKKDTVIIPLIVTLDDKEYKDRVEISVTDFYQHLRAGQQPRTAQITPPVFLEEFKNLLEKEEEIIALIFSSGLSGTYNSALLAKELLKEKGEKVHIVDTRSASVGLGLIILEIQRLIANGEKLPKILERAEDMSRRMEHLIVVDNLEMLKKGGRISSAQAMIGGMLNIKPILEIANDGKIYPLDRARGWKKALNRICDVFAERADLENLEQISVTHCDNIETAMELTLMIKERFGHDNIFVTEMGPVISSHVGLGTIGLAFLNKGQERAK